ncbi:anthranilate synthase component I family protein [Flavobacteriales bacterium]|nr:anthranilate synthase component I family protein [Flavobacteriales bacterium]
MKKKVKYSVASGSKFKKKVIHYLSRYDCFCVLDTNQNLQKESFSFVAAFKKNIELTISNNIFADLDTFIDQNSDWIFGFITYDFKNQIEQLSSSNPDYQKFPLLHFFIPEIIINVLSNDVEILYASHYSLAEIKKIFNDICALNCAKKSNKSVAFKSRVSKEKYIANINSIKKHLQSGDIYELNYCQEFYADNVDLNPYQLFLDLNNQSNAPYSGLYKINNHLCLCASPERFMKKSDKKIMSQPIKGTIKKLDDIDLDKKNQELLLNSSKDFSENVMIVDLVRNDLSRIAVPLSVKVNELAGLYSYQNVHHLVSTISCEIGHTTSFSDIIKALFPMGSMTGAPKIKAMNLIEKYEDTLRGIYSGSLGYIDPEKNFDFNVVIRSIFYNSQTKYLSFMVGGAITIESDPESEYEECMSKVQSIINVLS